MMEKIPKPPFTLKELKKKGLLPFPNGKREPGLYLLTHRIGRVDVLVPTLFNLSSPKEDWEKWVLLVPHRKRGSWVGWSPPQWNKLIFSPFFVVMKRYPFAVAGWQPDLVVILTKKGRIFESENPEGVMLLHQMLLQLQPYSEEELFTRVIGPEVV